MCDFPQDHPRPGVLFARDDPLRPRSRRPARTALPSRSPALALDGCGYVKKKFQPTSPRSPGCTRFVPRTAE